MVRGRIELPTLGFSDRRFTDYYEVVDRPGEMAINQALRFLGGRSKEGRDEFAAIGLDRYRWTDEWAAAARR